MDESMDLGAGSTSAQLPGTPSDGRATKGASRKSHRKTRTGCKTCKQRKIKCDESRPQCNNCIRHSVDCDFLLSNHSHANSPASGFQQHHASPATGTPNSNHAPNSDRMLTSNHIVPLQGLNLQDLELLHNYCTNTATTLTSDPSIKNLFRVRVPQLGLQYEFVMRGALAFSALHLSRFNIEKRDYYLAQASHHQDVGLRAATALLPNLTEENCSAVYIFSAFTLYYALASPRRSNDMLILGENGVADWLFLLKGTNYIMSSTLNDLRAGPFGPLFEAGSRRNEFREAQAAAQTLLQNPVDELVSLIHNSVNNLKHRQEYDHALSELRKSFVMVYTQGMNYETGDIFIWLFGATEGFMELLRAQTQESLAILAYFCVLMRRLEHHWWVEGWSLHLIAKIHDLLDQEHRLWIRFPIEEIGWIPT